MWPEITKGEASWFESQNPDGTAKHQRPQEARAKPRGESGTPGAEQPRQHAHGASRPPDLGPDPAAPPPASDTGLRPSLGTAGARGEHGAEHKGDKGKSNVN